MVGMSMPDVRVRLLEGFELSVEGEQLQLPPSAERLVAFLALQHRPVVRNHVAGTLWGDRDEARAAACLRSAIWRTNSGHDAQVIDAARSRIALHGNVIVDARDAVTVAHKQISGAIPAEPETFTGELLPGWYDDWVLLERERLRQLCLEGMERMAQSLLDAGQASLAIEAALSVVTAEPLRESAHRILVEAHVAAGNRSEAIRQFERCRALLSSELGLQPCDSLVEAAGRAHGPASVTQAALGLLTESVSPLKTVARR
jgi:DNA-binding SARP family transcriptional activator